MMAVVLAGLAAVLTAGSERRPAPPFRLQAYDGSMQSLAGLQGKVVVLNFWATWCGPCREEIPILRRVRREYTARGVEVLGVAMDGRGWPAVTPFVAARGIDYPILLGTPAVARAYGGLKTLPHTVFIDRHGRVVATASTVLEEASLRRIIGLLVAEQVGPTAIDSHDRGILLNSPR